MTGIRPGFAQSTKVLVLLVSAAAMTLATSCSSRPAIRPGWTGYMMTLEQARELDYQVAWQSAFAITTTGVTNSIVAYDDVVIATENGANVVSALSERDGTPLWQEAIGDSLERLLGVVPSEDEVIAWTQSDCYLLDVMTGRQNAHQRYGAAQVAHTLPLVLRPFAIYGTPDGRIIYHHLDLGIMKSAYRVDNSAVRRAPVLAGSAMVVLTDSARINYLDPIDNHRRWVNQTLDPIDTKPVSDGVNVYLAGEDQSVWAYRLADGKIAWRFRTQSPLRDDPTLINGVLYQAVPDRGLTAIDTSNGQEIWSNPSVPAGTVVTMNQHNELIVWQSDPGEYSNHSTIYRVDGRTGDAIATVRCQGIALVCADNLINGSIYGASRNGRVIKLVP